MKYYKIELTQAGLRQHPLATTSIKVALDKFVKYQETNKQYHQNKKLISQLEEAAQELTTTLIQQKYNHNDDENNLQKHLSDDLSQTKVNLHNLKKQTYYTEPFALVDFARSNVKYESIELVGLELKEIHQLLITNIECRAAAEFLAVAGGQLLPLEIYMYAFSNIKGHTQHNDNASFDAPKNHNIWRKISKHEYRYYMLQNYGTSHNIDSEFRATRHAQKIGHAYLSKLSESDHKNFNISNFKDYTLDVDDTEFDFAVLPEYDTPMTILGEVKLTTYNNEIRLNYEKLHIYVKCDSMKFAARLDQENGSIDDNFVNINQIKADSTLISIKQINEKDYFSALQCFDNNKSNIQPKSKSWLPWWGAATQNPNSQCQTKPSDKDKKSISVA